MLVVNLYGGPGIGKSTTAAGVYAVLKMRGVRCELVTEVAKDLTWEARSHALSQQPYIFGKQLLRLSRIADKVDVAVTDAPLLLQMVYARMLGEPDSMLTTIRDYDQRYRAGDHRSLDAMLVRRKPFDPVGRNQDEMESIRIDVAIENMLMTTRVREKCLYVNGGEPATIDFIADEVTARLMEMHV